MACGYSSISSRFAFVDVKSEPIVMRFSFDFKTRNLFLFSLEKTIGDFIAIVPCDEEVSKVDEVVTSDGVRLYCFFFCRFSRHFFMLIRCSSARRFFSSKCSLFFNAIEILVFCRRCMCAKQILIFGGDSNLPSFCEACDSLTSSVFHASGFSWLSKSPLCFFG